MLRLAPILPHLCPEVATRAFSASRRIRLALYLPAVVAGVILGALWPLWLPAIPGALVGMRNPGLIAVIAGPFAILMSIAWMLHQVADWVLVRRLVAGNPVLRQLARARVSEDAIRWMVSVALATVIALALVVAVS